MVELVDAADSKSAGAIRGGSSPSTRTILSVDILIVYQYSIVMSILSNAKKIVEQRRVDRAIEEERKRIHLETAKKFRDKVYSAVRTLFYEIDGEDSKFGKIKVEINPRYNGNILSVYAKRSKYDEPKLLEIDYEQWKTEPDGEMNSQSYEGIIVRFYVHTDCSNWVREVSKEKLFVFDDSNFESQIKDFEGWLTCYIADIL